MGRNIGIDLGTANTIVHVKGMGIVIREPSVVAVNKKTHGVIAVGDEAKKMLGRTPASVIAVRPLKDGVIADFEMAEQMLRYFIRKAVGKTGSFSRPNIVICVPSGVTEVERMAVEEAAEAAGARRPVTVEEPIAAAVGAGIDIAETSGNMVVDIGGGTSEMAVISMGGIVYSKSLRIAGDALDRAVIAYIRKEYNVLIGERSAEEAKITAGAVYPLPTEEYADVKGRDLISGLPKNIRISSSEMQDALMDTALMIVDGIRVALENTPPELAADIMKKGIMLTGGGAYLRGMDKLINLRTGMPVIVAKDPMDCVAIGTGKCLEDDELYAMLTRDRQ